MLLLSCILAVLATTSEASPPRRNRVSKRSTTIIDNAFIIELAESDPSLSTRGLDSHTIFHRRASESIDYSVRHQYNTDTFNGLSIFVTDISTNTQQQLQSLPGVVNVWPVVSVPRPGLDTNFIDPGLSYSNASLIQRRAIPAPITADLSSSLEMGGVDKLHQHGIKGKGIKIGVIDSGVDYRNPALGAGFGPGFKIAGGYSFVNDNGTLTDSPDPLVTCLSGGHGTHVSGILAMDPIIGASGFDISGVAPEASIYMYRVFDCANAGGSDTIMAGMLKAQEDGVDVISMSLAIETELPGQVDPLTAVIKSITSAGIAVVVAVGNEASWNEDASELYLADDPSTEPTAIAVGAIANIKFPLVYTAVDSNSDAIKYASIWPLNLPSADVYILSDGCGVSDWSDALTAVHDSGNINNTIFAFEAFASTTYCNPNSIGEGWDSLTFNPVYIMAFNSNISGDPFLLEYNLFSPGFFSTSQFINVNTADGITLVNNYDQGGGFMKYKLDFSNTTFSSTSQLTGGFVDYYSNFGPDYFTYELKPQLSAPGGHILSTWPIGPDSNYAIISGTSMATPYVAASYGLVKSQFPKASVGEILNLLQTTSSPVKWIWDSTIVASTAQQGAGLINAYNAIFSESKISPGQITITDVTKSIYGTANITIENQSGHEKTYTLSHQGAGYMDRQLNEGTPNQQALYGTGVFPTPTIKLSPGDSAIVEFSITSPTGVIASNQPVFGGFINVADSSGEAFSVPYIGPPYSLYNTEYIYVAVVEAFADDGTPAVDDGFLAVNPVNQYGIAADIPLQYSLAFRFDLLPANTTIKATNYGFNTSSHAVPAYSPSSYAPNSTIFGHPSFGTLWNATTTEAGGAIQPGNFINYWGSTTVVSSNGATFDVGDGDYRFFASVLRWGGDAQEESNWDTWLGPVLRFNSSL